MHERNQQAVMILQGQLRDEIRRRDEAQHRAESLHNHFQEAASELSVSQRALDQEHSQHEATKTEFLRLQQHLEYVDHVVYALQRTFDSGNADDLRPLSELVDEAVASIPNQGGMREAASENTRAKALHALREILESRQRDIWTAQRGDREMTRVKSEDGDNEFAARIDSGTHFGSARSANGSPGRRGRRQPSRRVKARCHSTGAP